MITVALDASTYAGSVAVLDGSRLVAERDVTMKGGDPQQERLMPAVAAALAQAHVTSRDVRRIVCGSGPGSFTSLRIAASIAKGLAFGLGCPLCAVPSLALIVAAASPRAGSYLAALDALRGEMYVGLYAVTPDGEVDETEAPRLAPSGSIETLATRMAASVVGPGMVATRRVLEGCRTSRACCALADRWRSRHGNRHTAVSRRHRYDGNRHTVVRCLRRE